MSCPKVAVTAGPLGFFKPIYFHSLRSSRPSPTAVDGLGRPRQPFPWRRDGRHTVTAFTPRRGYRIVSVGHICM